MKTNGKKIDFVSIILLIILTIVIFCYIQISVFKNEYINFCGYTLFHVITGSMSSTIEINDVVLEKITKDVNKDDIITYKSKFDDGVNFITHRVIKKENAELITKGDANSSEDNPINIDDVVGKVIFIFHTSVWLKVLKEPLVIMTITISCIAVYFLFKKKI